MSGRLLKEESGVALPLAIFTVVIVAVMGAGLLTFASTDLNTVVEANQGQKAFEVADAGIKAAEWQLKNDSTPSKYDGGLTTDIQWSSSTSNSNCLSLGDRGMCLENPDGNGSTVDGVNVTIEYRPTKGDFRVFSTGGYGNEAKRRIEAVFEAEEDLNIPLAYFSRTFIDYGGTADARGISLFSLGNINFSGNAGITDDQDFYFKRWAEYSLLPSQSYPNTFNRTARSSALAGAGALGTVNSGGSSNVALSKNTRVFDSNTPVKMVPNWDTSDRLAATKISFPFDTSKERMERDIDMLRGRAQELEAEDPSFDYYRTGVSGSQPLNSWPAGSNQETVVFYEFSSYSSSNQVDLGLSGGTCTDPSSKGVIVVVNGNFDMPDNTKFGGGIIAYAPGVDDVNKGTFRSRDTSCVSGFISTTGKIDSQGTPDAGSTEALSTLPSFMGGTEMTSWRECYSAASGSC